MTSAAFSFRPASRSVLGTYEATPAQGGFSAPHGLRFDHGDFCAVAFAFAFAAGLVFGGALACDTYLFVIIGRGALDDFAAYQLARDLLPWSAIFTVIAAGVAGFGLKLACKFRTRQT